MDVDVVQLLARTDCPDCENGLVVSDDWVAFQEWRSRRSSLDPEAEDDLVERYFIEVCGYGSVPPMSEPCSRCENGKVSVEVPLREILDVVLEHVNRPVLKPGEVDELVLKVKQAITAAAFQSEGLRDGLEMGTWLRAVQEGSEALRSLATLRATPSGGF